MIENLSRSPELDVFNETHPAAFVNWRLRADNTLQDLVHSSRARCVLFKPIVETHRARDFLQLFPESRILFAVRNPADTINSMQRFFNTTDQVVAAWAASSRSDTHFPVNATDHLKDSYMQLYRADDSLSNKAAVIWWVRNRLFFELGLAQESRTKLIDYDELVQAPEATFREACAFLGITYRTSMAKGVSRRSQGKHPPPELRTEVGHACAGLWEELERCRIAATAPRDVA